MCSLKFLYVPSSTFSLETLPRLNWGGTRRTIEKWLHSSQKESLFSSPEMISWTQQFATKLCLHTEDSFHWKQPGPCPVLLLISHVTWDALCLLYSPGSSSRSLAPLRMESPLLPVFQRLSSSRHSGLPANRNWALPVCLAFTLGKVTCIISSLFGATPELILHKLCMLL